MKHYKRFPLLLLILTVAFFVGCNSKPSLKGKVTYEDGTPVTVGMVNFASSDTQARGKINPDGTFTVGTLKQADGLPPGTYKVYVTGTDLPDETAVAAEPELDSMGQPIQQMGKRKQLVDRQFMSVSTTPLTCTVPAENNTYDVVVKKPEM